MNDRTVGNRSSRETRKWLVLRCPLVAWQTSVHWCELASFFSLAAVFEFVFWSFAAVFVVVVVVLWFEMLAYTLLLSWQHFFLAFVCLLLRLCVYYCIYVFVCIIPAFAVFLAAFLICSCFVCVSVCRCLSLFWGGRGIFFTPSTRVCSVRAFAPVVHRTSTSRGRHKLNKIICTFMYCRLKIAITDSNANLCQINITKYNVVDSCI